MINFTGKTIILAVPNHFGLPEVFKKNLEFLGFKVFLLEHNSSKIKLSAEQSIKHFWRKNLRGDSTFKAQWYAKRKEGLQLQFLEKVNEADFALVIRPDLFSDNVLEKVRKKSTYAVAYQWDGMSRFPLVEKTMRFFDEFFVFDKSDTISFPGTKHTDNFYFDYLPGITEIKYDVFFVGTYMKDRIKELAFLSKTFDKMGLKSSINVIYRKERHIRKFRESPIHFTKTDMSFAESIAKSKSSSIILDFQNSFHNGLSFRSFEALGYKKKLITNNPLVKNYDFYHPNNIFLLDNNWEEIKSFIDGKYFVLPEEIIEKFSFTKWIGYILGQ